MSLLRPAVIAALIALTTAAPAHAAGDPIMPLSQVQRGMQCTGYSVIRGTDVASFNAEVLDVLSGPDPAILVRLSGPAIDATGAGPGFSGSPVYCPDPADGVSKVIGAIAFGIGEYDNKTLLLTPIEEMLDEPVVPPPSARRMTAREHRQRRPLGTALSIAGLSPPVADAFRRGAARAGRTLATVPAAPRATGFPVQTLRPGSAVSVGYSSGDIALGGIGTVTYVDGNDIWAFGHPLDSVGRRSLFLEDAYVYDVISSPSVGGAEGTYKLAAPGHDIGMLSGDGIHAVTGTVGALPPSIPMTVKANDRDNKTSESLHVQLADEREVGNPTGFSPLGFVGTSAVAQAAYSALHGSPLNTSGSMCVSFKVAERTKALGFCNTYVAAGTGLASDGAGALLGSAPVSDFGSAAALLDTYRAGPLTVTSVNVTLNLRRGLAQAYMTRLTGPEKVTRGKDYPVRMFFRRPGSAKEESVSFKVHAPIGMTRGKRDLVLSGTPSDLAGGGFASLLADLLGDGSTDEAGPPSLAVLSKQVGAIHRYDGVTASFRPRHGKKETLAGPTTADALPSGAAGRALRERPVYRDGSVRYSGAVSIPVVVR
ncbi:MAG: hypothetical protein ACJ762_03785 [Solirubrobacteraceae bacterium]